MSLTDNIKEYSLFIRELSDNNINKTFFNLDSDHAIIVLSEIFRVSNETVRIFASSLCREVGSSPEYIEALSDFIERGGEVRILLNAHSSELLLESNLYKRLAFYVSEGKSIKIKSTTAKPYRTGDIEKKEVHFTIGDKKSYRIETNINTRSAEGNMNNPPLAEAYANFFDSMFDDENEEIDLKFIFNN